MAGIDSVAFMNMRKSTPDLGEPVLVHSSSTKFWVNPETLPDVTTPSMISETAGNVSDYIKRLSANTFAAYGVGSDDCFAHDVGKKVKFTNVDVDRKGKREGRVEATTVAEVVVDKSMVNGNNMMHGGCIAYLIDNCCSSALVVLGLAIGRNGVGVTQALNVIYHAPAPLNTLLQIESSSLVLGNRSMTASCRIVEKESGRLVASATMTKMQPSKL